MTFPSLSIAIAVAALLLFLRPALNLPTHWRVNCAESWQESMTTKTKLKKKILPNMFMQSSSFNQYHFLDACNELPSFGERIDIEPVKIDARGKLQPVEIDELPAFIQRDVIHEGCNFLAKRII